MEFAAPDSLPPGAGDRIGRYHVVGKIAQGGMAEVLLAKLVGPQGFERPVVIKRILPNLVNDKKFIEMFLDEAKLIAGIRHPNVVQVQELSEAGEYFLVMEFLAGETLSSVMRRLAAKGKRLPYAVCAYIVAEAAAGLHAAHELRDGSGERRNVVHRDVSPQNIFVCYDGVVKVIDFGIAKATDRMTKTEAGQLKGKFAYMSPESCRGAKIDRRTDLFALATVLYEISTCMRLFVRSTDMKTLEAVCYEPIRRPSEIIKDYPRELEAIVMRGLERDPANRYQSGAEMRRDLVRVAHTLAEGAGLPEEQLGVALNGMFADRIREKNDMIRRVRAGALCRAAS
jgi:serine/threonine protein kinase